MEKKSAYLYYFILIVIMALWDGIGIMIPMALRIGYFALVFLPLIKWRELIPAVFVSTITIAFSAFTSPLLPTSIFYYEFLLFGLFVIIIGQNLITPSIIFIFIFLYVLLSNIIIDSSISYTAIKILFCLLMFSFVKGDGGKCNEHMPYAFMMIAIVLSYWVLLRPEARTYAIHIQQGYEEAGAWTDPNYLGCIIALGGTVAINELFNKKENLLKTLFCVSTMVFSIFALAYLASRGAFVALVTGAVVLVVFSKKTKNNTKLVFVILMTIFLIFMYRSSYFDLIIIRFQAESMETGTGRTIIWANKLDDFFNKSNIFRWIFGFGNNKGLTLGKLDGGIRAAHNDFVTVLVTYGFVGLFLFLYTFYYAIKKASKTNKVAVCSLLGTYIAVCMTLDPTFSAMPTSVVFIFYLFYVLMFSRTKETTV